MSQQPIEAEPLLELEDAKIKEPALYRVFLHNDDYTSMDFVVSVLMEVFQKPLDEATEIMLSVHKKGIGVCGVYTREVAEFRVLKTISLARQAGFPLLCTMEKE